MDDNDTFKICTFNCNGLGNKEVKNRFQTVGGCGWTFIEDKKVAGLRYTVSSKAKRI